MFNLRQIEIKIKQSSWWQKASSTVDSHHSNNSAIMLTHHLLSVHRNIEVIFQQPETGFFGSLFALLRQLKLDKKEVENELKVVALLHDIGKTEEDKTLLIAHPLTGKPAHKRHGIVSMTAAMEILGTDLSNLPEERQHVYRTIELHDMSFGLYREFNSTRITPAYARWTHINNKIFTQPGAGLLYLLIFKLADIHGHANISDVHWFYNAVKANYFNLLDIELPIPDDADIR